MALTELQRRYLGSDGRPPSVARRRYGRSGHGYTAGQRRLASVTGILGAALPKPALTKWAAREVAQWVASHRDQVAALNDSELVDLLVGVPFRERDAAARRGTEVHTLAQRLLAGDEVEIPDELSEHVRSYERFVTDWRPQDVAVEAVVVSHARSYAGTLDYLGVLDGVPGLSLVDIKTGRSGIFGEVALQLAGYAYSDAIVVDGLEYPMPEVDQAFALHVRADGYDLIPVCIDPPVFQFFRACAAVAQRVPMLDNSADEPLVGVPLTPPARRLEVVS